MELQKASDFMLRRRRPLLSLIGRAAQGPTANAQRPDLRPLIRQFTTSPRCLQESSQPPQSRSGQQDGALGITGLFRSNKPLSDKQPARVSRSQVSTLDRPEAKSRSTDSPLGAKAKGNDGTGSSIEDLIGSLSPKTPPHRSQGHRGSGISIADQIGGQHIIKPPPQQLGPTSIRLGPSLGRTVYVNMDQGRDLARSFRAVELLCSRNGVRRDVFRQRFHERGGTKRKRLRGERWRRRFKEGFQGMVSRVQTMRKMGW